jgi:hypothetical protein
MTREVIAATLMVWLIGAIVGWCIGWAVRGENNRRWHENLMRQLVHTRAELADALDELDELDRARSRSRCDAERVPAPAPAVVNVHVAAPLAWPSPQPMVPTTDRFVDATPILPAREVTS